MKVYAVTYYNGDADVTIKIFSKKENAKKYVAEGNKQDPSGKHSGGAYYNVIEWKVDT